MTITSSPAPDIVNIVLNKRGVAWHCLMVDAAGNVVRNAVTRDSKVMRYVLEDLRDGFGQVPAKLPEADGIVAAEKSQGGRGTSRIVSLAKFWQIYLQYLRASGKAEGTVRTYQLAYKKIIQDNQIEKIDDLTFERIEAWARDKIASGIRARSVDFYIRNVRAALEWGVDNQYLRKNPLEAWEPANGKEPPRQRDLTPDELRAVFLAEPDEEWRVRWMVYLYSGFRNQGEGALRWEWIDWEKREVALPIGKGKRKGRPRHIRLHPKLQTALAAWREKKLDRCESVDSGPVLRKLIPKTICQRLKDMCREAQIDPKGVNLFSIRHTYEKALREE